MSADQAETLAITPETQTRARAPKERRVPLDVVRRVAETVSNCEFSIDQAYVATAEFAMLMPSIRAKTQLPFGSAEVSVNKATEALHYLALARQAIRESHEGLNILGRKSGLDLKADLPFVWK
jgi:hypothetical protein